MSKKKDETEPRWTPIRRGATYCSPACGCKCTYAAYLLARRRALRLARRLGPGFVAHVWENAGWHYEALIDGAPVRIEVHGSHYPSGKPSFMAFVHNRFVSESDNPDEALNRSMGMLIEAYNDFGNAIRMVEQARGK